MKWKESLAALEDADQLNVSVVQKHAAEKFKVEDNLLEDAKKALKEESVFYPTVWCVVSVASLSNQYALAGLDYILLTQSLHFEERSKSIVSR